MAVTPPMGTLFSHNEMTAAHRRLPLGTKDLVENRESGEQVEVKITDRGPYADKKRRIIDLSNAAADSVGLVEAGVAQVRVVVTEEAAQRQNSPDESLMYEVQVGPLNGGKRCRQCSRRYGTGCPTPIWPPGRGRKGLLQGPGRSLH